LSSLGEKVPVRQSLEVSEDSIKKIEEIFVEEVSFFFYLNLNTFKIVSSNLDPHFNGLESEEILGYRPWYMNQSERHLGSPKQRLMSVLSKDNAIREWFSKQTMNILSYRNQISKKMSEFSNDIAQPQIYRRRQAPRIKESTKKPSESEFIYEEYDIRRICSDIELPYEY
jgi:hypothetical protein